MFPKRRVTCQVATCLSPRCSVTLYVCVCVCVCVFTSLSFSLLLFFVFLFFEPLFTQQRRKTIVLFGAGRSSSSLIRYLLHHSEKENWSVRVADISRSVAAQVCLSGHFSSCVCVCICVCINMRPVDARVYACLRMLVSLWSVCVGLCGCVCVCVCVSVSTLLFLLSLSFPRSFTSSLLCSHYSHTLENHGPSEWYSGGP
jgi:hypothetical protein